MSSCCGSGKIFRGVREKEKPIRSYIPEVVEKLRKIPEYRGLSDDKLAEEAEVLIDPEKLWVTYFSEITTEPAALRVEQTLDENKEMDYETSLEAKMMTKRSKRRVEEVANFQFKLLLRQIRSGVPYGARETFASILQMQYGPLHASLMIDNKLILEWNASSLVIPRGKPITPTAAQLATTVKDHDKHQHTLEKSYSSNDEIAILFDATANKVELMQRLIKLISKYNRRCYYNPVFRNCQTFVTEAMETLGSKNPPKFKGVLKAYFEQLKKSRPRASFEGHAELDAYVAEKIASGSDTLKKEEKEYLLGQYFLFHMSSMTLAENPDRWVCNMKSCQMAKLERLINHEDLLANRFFNESTL